MFSLHSCELQIRLMLSCYLCKRRLTELRNGGSFLLIRQFGKQSVSLVLKKKRCVSIRWDQTHNDCDIKPPHALIVPHQKQQELLETVRGKKYSEQEQQHKTVGINKYSLSSFTIFHPQQQVETAVCCRQRSPSFQLNFIFTQRDDKYLYVLFLK